MKTILACLAILTLMILFAYGAWSLNRWFNYRFGYEASVQTTVCELVKPEALKEPC